MSGHKEMDHEFPVKDDFDVLGSSLRVSDLLFVEGVVAAQFGPWIGVTEAKSSQGFPYMHGGVGSAEREYMEERGKSYNVKFSFAEKRGAYLAGVKTVLEGEQGTEIVNLISDGPWFYIQLPPGTYNWKATFGPNTNEIKAFKVSKDKKMNRTLTWDSGAEADGWRCVELFAFQTA